MTQTRYESTNFFARKISNYPKQNQFQAISLANGLHKLYSGQLKARWRYHVGHFSLIPKLFLSLFFRVRHKTVTMSQRHRFLKSDSNDIFFNNIESP